MSKIGSKIKNVAGAIQEAAGKTIGDPVMAAKGHMKKDEGSIEQGELPEDYEPGKERPTFG